ncbi:MAG: DUF448 domain-containing protein [Erythrobacter sp.]|uniref:DUF448 domain-containing protein n=1 Tax=Erythrobacter sp. TaxID=1042 RepID=UPI001B020A4F|nr:DUF448 domain-containing protein [Erythrobacter sp.]MBO6769126.1 DUF448 domain-containing protein [Erythrobacter sp.]
MRTPPNERLTSDIVETPRPRKAEPAKSCPERRCILSGKTAPRETLVRLVASPAGLVLPDAQEKAPGRGAWIGVSREELAEAQAAGKLKGALSRSFKSGELELPSTLPQMVEDALTRTLLDRLGLEMRVGSLILGTQRIAEAARGGAIALLLHASDASEDGRKKLDQAWRVGREAEGSGERGLELPLDRNALSVALGRDNVVHLALADDASAARVIKPLTRLMHYLGHTFPAGTARADLRADDDLND